MYYYFLDADKSCQFFIDQINSLKEDGKFLYSYIPLVKCCLDGLGTIAERFPFTCRYSNIYYKIFCLK